MTAAVVNRYAGEHARRAAISVLAAAVAAIGLWAIPGAAGTTWTDVLGSLRSISTVDLVVLVLLWWAGIYSHSFVLTASLPGLSRRRALLLNLGGSAVSDVLPFGGAAGAALNLAMVRSWRFTARRFATFAAVSNLWNVTAKLGLPIFVLAVVLANGTVRSHGLVVLTGSLLVLLVVVVSATVTAVVSDRAARAIGSGLDRVAASLLQAFGSSRRTALADALLATRADTAEVIRRGWPQLTAGMLGYLVLQGLLWATCLHVLSVQVPVTAALAAFAVERALSTMPITPGGVGVAEAGAVTVLVAAGGDPLAVTAAVLLFRVFAFLIEIPVGGAGILIWLWTCRPEGAA